MVLLSSADLSHFVRCRSADCALDSVHCHSSRRCVCHLCRRGVVCADAATTQRKKRSDIDIGQWYDQVGVAVPRAVGVIAVAIWFRLAWPRHFDVVDMCRVASTTICRVREGQTALSCGRRHTS